MPVTEGDHRPEEDVLIAKRASRVSIKWVFCSSLSGRTRTGRCQFIALGLTLYTNWPLALTLRRGLLGKPFSIPTMQSLQCSCPNKLSVDKVGVNGATPGVTWRFTGKIVSLQRFKQRY